MKSIFTILLILISSIAFTQTASKHHMIITEVRQDTTVTTKTMTVWGWNKEVVEFVYDDQFLSFQIINSHSHDETTEKWRQITIRYKDEYLVGGRGETLFLTRNQWDELFVIMISTTKRGEFRVTINRVEGKFPHYLFQQIKAEDNGDDADNE